MVGGAGVSQTDATMTATLDLISVTFAKTELGQREIQSRSLGLAPLVRRLLVLVDGQKRGRDLAAFFGDTNIEPLLGELLDKGCVQARQEAAAAAGPGMAAPVVDAWAGLPDAATRSAADNEMARHFMINTANAIFGQNMRLTLIETIAKAQGTEGLRQAFLAWQQALQDDRIGVKRLTEFRPQLFKVL